MMSNNKKDKDKISLDVNIGRRAMYACRLNKEFSSKFSEAYPGKHLKKAGEPNDGNIVIIATNMRKFV